MLNGWETGKVKDMASNRVCKRILSRSLLLSGDSELAQELRGDLQGLRSRGPDLPQVHPQPERATGDAVIHH